MKRFLTMITASLALVASADRQPFERYQSVVDRQMFGPLPDDFDASKLPSEVQKRTGKDEKEFQAEQEKLKSAVHFSVINVKSDGTVEVGFTDNSDPKDPCHYFICEGESAGGWKVVEADPETASIVLEKDGITLELTLGDNSAKGGGKMNASRQPIPPKTGGGFTSLQTRRRQLREEAERKRLEEDAKRRAAEKAEEAEKEAVEKAEREAEREEQRKQLQAIQDELRRVRVESQKKEAEKKDGGNENNVVE